MPKGTQKTSRKPNNTTKKEKLAKKLAKTMEERNKYKNATTPKAQMKYMKLSQKVMMMENEIENLDDAKHLDESVIDGIMDQYANNLEENVKAEIKSKLAKLTYDKNYRSCFSGEASINLYHQAVDKLSCFTKYGDKIE